MSLTPGASGLLDVRSTSILRSYVESINKCPPEPVPVGVGVGVGVGVRVGVAVPVAVPVPVPHVASFIDDCTPPACGYDRGKDMVSIIGAVIVVATVIGMIHTYPIFIPHMAIHYDSGFFELCLVGALMYLVFVLVRNLILTPPVFIPTQFLIKGKLTALFGLISVFVGVLIDSQVFHISVLYVSHILLIGIGGGLAYSASMSLPGDMFRKKLSVALMIMNISGSIGTIFFVWISAAAIDTLGYKWTKFMLAVFILFFTLAVHVYPKTSIMYDSKCDPSGNKTLEVRECIYRANEQRKMTTDECDDGNLLCVCVCDLRLYNDKSFLLFTFLMMVATMTFYIPYLTIISFAESVNAPLSAWYITMYCLGSIITRCALISNMDYTFTFNRTAFQICTLGILWIVINWAETFGWIMVVCLALGAMEGALCVLCPRVAIGTIPQRWLNGAWVTTIVFHALGTLIMNVFTSILALQTFQYNIAYITAGILMIIAALLATLLPQTGEGEETMNNDSTKMFTSHSNMQKTDYNYSYMRSAYGRPSIGRYSSQIHGRGFAGRGLAGHGLAGRGLGGRGLGGRGLAGHCNGPNGYKCNCPICSTIGCIPECLPSVCAPKGSLTCNGIAPTSQQPQPQSGTNNSSNSKDKANDKTKLPSKSPSKTKAKLPSTSPSKTETAKT